MSTDLSRSLAGELLAPSGGLGLVVSRALETVVVTIHGELDEVGSELLDLMLVDLTGDQGHRVVAVDLAHATGGLTTATVLAAAAGRARQRGGRFIVNEPPRQIVEALASRPWGELVEIEPQVEPR